MNKKKTSPLRALCLAGLAATMVFGVCAPAAAQKVMTVASLLAEDKPETQVWVKFRSLVEARLPGRFDIRIVPNAALGGEREVAEGVRLGSVQGTLSTLAALSRWVPEGQLFDLPFLFRNRSHLSEVLANAPGQDLLPLYEEQGFHVLGYVTYGARHLLAKEPLTRPEQVKGKRIRVIQSPLHADLWRNLGANPTPLPITETYNALKTGVVDLMDLTIPAYAGFRLNEVVPVVVETGHIWAVGALHVGRRFWEGLSEEEQRIFTEAGREATRYFDELMVAEEIATRASLAAAGVTFVAPEDLQAWTRAARPVWDSYGSKVGGLDKILSIAQPE